MNLFDLLGSLIPAWLLRRSLAFILGFSLMCIYLVTREVLAGRFWAILPAQ